MYIHICTNVIGDTMPYFLLIYTGCWVRLSLLSCYMLVRQVRFSSGYIHIDNFMGDTMSYLYLIIQAVCCPV